MNGWIVKETNSSRRESHQEQDAASELESYEITGDRNLSPSESGWKRYFSPSATPIIRFIPPCLVSLKSFHHEKRDTSDVLSCDTFALFSFLFAITLIAFTYEVLPQKTFSVILISECSQSGVRFGFLKPRHYDFIVVRTPPGLKRSH